MKDFLKKEVITLAHNILQEATHSQNLENLLNHTVTLYKKLCVLEFLQTHSNSSISEKNITLPETNSINILSNKIQEVNLNKPHRREIQISLNDRFAFIAYLFQGDTQAFENTLYQVAERHTLQEILHYLEQEVKPLYAHWQGKEQYEERFFQLITQNLK